MRAAPGRAAPGRAAPGSNPVRLVVSDVDGTIVTKDKSILPATVEAARTLRAAAIPLTVVSSRPPRGMAYILETLKIDGPVAAFNGGIVFHGGATVAQHLLAAEDARRAVEFYTQQNIQIWLFTADAWIVRDANGDYVDHERHTIGFAPTVVDDFAPYFDRCGKIVAVSADFAHLAEVERGVNALLQGGAVAQRSQNSYLDLNHRDANKGNALRILAGWYGIDPAAVAAIGDMTNDVPMFQAAGISIAMGNAPDEVAAQAGYRTGANTETGWADAIKKYILTTEGNNK